MTDAPQGADSLPRSHSRVRGTGRRMSRTGTTRAGSSRSEEPAHACTTNAPLVTTTSLVIGREDIAGSIPDRHPHRTYSDRLWRYGSGDRCGPVETGTDERCRMSGWNGESSTVEPDANGVELDGRTWSVRDQDPPVAQCADPFQRRTGPWLVRRHHPDALPVRTDLMATVVLRRGGRLTLPMGVHHAFMHCRGAIRHSLSRARPVRRAESRDGRFTSTA